MVNVRKRKPAGRRGGGVRKRTAQGKRFKPRRETDLGDVPVLDWYKEERQTARAREWRRRGLAVAVFVITILPALLLTRYQRPERDANTRPPAEKASLEERADPFELIASKERSQGRNRESRETAPRQIREEQWTTAERLQHDILRTAPEIFHSVRLELADGVYVEKTSALEIRLGKGSVKTIEILVKSGPWDSLPSEAKVNLLQNTFDMLRTSYPEVTKFVILHFDDRREDLNLKFGSDFSAIPS